MIEFENRRYVVLPYVDVTDEMITESLQLSKDYLTRTITSPDKTILTFEGDTPSCFSSYDILTWEQKRVLLSTSDWIDYNA